MVEENLSPLNRDLLAQILAMVDGPTLAAATCANSDLHDIAKADGLWESLCQSTWPSTREEKARNLISSLDGFLQFYANSFPLIVYKPKGEDPCEIESSGSEEASFPSPCDLVSFVDVYYKDKCIFSKVLYGIPGAEDENQNTGWFLDGPFRLDALQYQYGTSSINEDGDDEADDDEEEDIGLLPSVPLVEKKGKGGGKLCKKLEEKVRLSWVMLDTKSGRAANLSSWRPLSVQRHWPSEGDVLMHFGCIVPGVGAQPVECAISVKCRLLQREGCLQWRDICMLMEDKEGVHIDGKGSLMVLDRALKVSCRSSWKSGKFDRGYGDYMREKRVAREKRIRCEHLAEKLLFVCTGITLFAAFGHLLISFAP